MTISTIAPRRIGAVGVAVAAVALGGLVSGSAAATAAKRTATHVVCPAHVRLGASAACGVSVSDRSATATTPSGSVSLSSNVSGRFGPSATCTLRAINRRTARCSFTFHSNHRGPVRIYGSYTGDAKHSASHGLTTISVV